MRMPTASGGREMTGPHAPEPAQDRESSLGPVDLDRMTAAAEDLRERTMSLEMPEGATSWRFALVVIASVFVVAGLILAFRHPIVTAVHRLGL